MDSDDEKLAWYHLAARKFARRQGVDLDYGSAQDNVVIADDGLSAWVRAWVRVDASDNEDNPAGNHLPLTRVGKE